MIGGTALSAVSGVITPETADKAAARLGNVDEESLATVTEAAGGSSVALVLRGTVNDLAGPA